MSVASRRAAPPETSSEQPAPSGKLLLRMPRSLHGALTKAAEREETSLNQFITSTLASAIGWNGDDTAADGTGAHRTGAHGPRQIAHAEPRASRALLAVLVANAIAVGLAALGAVGILLLAWLG